MAKNDIQECYKGGILEQIRNEPNKVIGEELSDTQVRYLDEIYSALTYLLEVLTAGADVTDLERKWEWIDAIEADLLKKGFNVYYPGVIHEEGKEPYAYTYTEGEKKNAEREL